MEKLVCVMHRCTKVESNETKIDFPAPETASQWSKTNLDKSTSVEIDVKSMETNYDIKFQVLTCGLCSVYVYKLGQML